MGRGELIRVVGEDTEKRKGVQVDDGVDGV